MFFDEEIYIVLDFYYVVEKRMSVGGIGFK